MDIDHPSITAKPPPRDLTTAEILSNLLSTPLPVSNPLALDLGDDDADVRWLLACLGGTGGDANDSVAFLGGDGMNVDGSGKAPMDKELAKRHEDQVMVDAARLSAADSESLENPLIPKIKLNVKGKGKDRGGEVDVDVTMLDHREESESGWPAKIRTKHASNSAAATKNAANSNAIASSSNIGTSSTDAATSERRHGPYYLPSIPPYSTSFSPVDWSKTHLLRARTPVHEKSPQVVKLSSRATLVLKPPDGQTAPKPTKLKKAKSRPAASPIPKRSYTLPALPEGSIAALRQEMLGHVYPNSTVYGDAKGLGLGSEGGLEDMVMDADVGERMLIPESEDVQEFSKMDESQDVVGQGSGYEEGSDVVMNPEKDRKQEEAQDKKGKKKETRTSKLASMSDFELGLAAFMEMAVMQKLSRSPLSGLRFGSKAPSSTSQQPPDLPVVDMNRVESGPSRKKIKLDTLPAPDGVSAAPSSTHILPGQFHSPLSLVPSTSATTEDKPQVQDLVLDKMVSPSSSLRPQPRPPDMETDVSDAENNAGVHDKPEAVDTTEPLSPNRRRREPESQPTVSDYKAIPGTPAQGGNSQCSNYPKLLASLQSVNIVNELRALHAKEHRRLSKPGCQSMCLCFQCLPKMPGRDPKMEKLNALDALSLDRDVDMGGQLQTYPSQTRVDFSTQGLLLSDDVEVRQKPEMIDTTESLSPNHTHRREPQSQPMVSDYDFKSISEKLEQREGFLSQRQSASLRETALLAEACERLRERVGNLRWPLTLDDMDGSFY